MRLTPPQPAPRIHRNALGSKSPLPTPLLTRVRKLSIQRPGNQTPAKPAWRSASNCTSTRAKCSCNGRTRSTAAYCSSVAFIKRNNKSVGSAALTPPIKTQNADNCRCPHSELFSENSGQVLVLICHIIMGRGFDCGGWVAPLCGGAQASLRAGAEPRSGATSGRAPEIVHGGGRPIIQRGMRPPVIV